MRVRTDVDASDPTRTRIHVEDTGPGIPEPELEALHQPEEAPLVHGSGIGLWVARWIVLRSNGSFEIVNTEAGCRVTVTLQTSRPSGSRSGRTPIARFLE